VFACFTDYCKAFDKVNYWKLFKQLIDDGVNGCILERTFSFRKFISYNILSIGKHAQLNALLFFLSN